MDSHWPDGSAWRRECWRSRPNGHSSSADYSFGITALFSGLLRLTSTFKFSKSQSERHGEDLTTQVLAEMTLLHNLRHLRNSLPPRICSARRLATVSGATGIPGAQVPMSLLEKVRTWSLFTSVMLMFAQNAFLPYPKLQRNLDVLRRRLDRPLVLSEKILYT